MQGMTPLTHFKVTGHKEATRAIHLLKKEDLDTIRKKAYTIFLKSWDNKKGGEMTKARFYSGTSHLKSQEDWESIRGIYRWCKEKKVPFSPVFYKKFMLKSN